MTIEEIKKQKTDAEDQILYIIRHMRELTGMNVSVTYTVTEEEHKLTGKGVIVDEQVIIILHI